MVNLTCRHLTLTPTKVGDKLAKEYDKLFKLVALVFINALMRVLGMKPGIIRIEYPEVFTQEAERGIMDFPVLTIDRTYVIFEFHSRPLTPRLLLRNFQYLANLRARVNHPVDLHIISLDKLKKSVRSVLITPDWEFKPKFTFLIDLDGDEILNIIKYKLENNLELTEDDAYLFSIVPFTTHKMETIELVEDLCYFVNEIKLPEEIKYIIKLSQILWVNALINDKELSEELIDVIKMKSNFIQNYEKKLVESAIDKRNKEIAEQMKKENYSAKEILKLTGVNILLK